MSFKYFTLDEFVCSETGENEISLRFVGKLDELREKCGFAFKITSGYRSPEHSIEKAKARPGWHTTGFAADIAIKGGARRYKLISEALDMNFTGIGVAKTFVHLDVRGDTPVMWGY